MVSPISFVGTVPMKVHIILESPYMTTIKPVKSVRLCKECQKCNKIEFSTNQKLEDLQGNEV